MGLAVIALVSVGAFKASTSRPTNAVDKTEVAVHAPVMAASTLAPVDIGPPPLATPPPSAVPPISPPVSAAAVPALTGLDAELALLNEAHAALAQNPASALAPLRKHASRFPQGALRPEREFLLADALFRAGRLAEARAQIKRARPVLAGTPYRARLDALEARLPPDDGSGN
jgi:TolA-binding protein